LEEADFMQKIKEERVKAAYKLLKDCTVCPRSCHVDRTAGVPGYCGMTETLVVSSVGPHFGEEPPLVGSNGSGTIFLCGCNLRCIFCQNYDISHGGHGRQFTVDQMAGSMMRLQQTGCHNINFVTPTHFSPQIMDAIIRARKRGLKVPIVYNCGGYESVEMLRLLDGLVEIYMPDIKFFSPALAERYCNAADYPDVVRAAVKEMHRQVGDLEIGDDGVAVKGLLIRHLVMPGAAEDSRAVIDFVSSEISQNSYINVMDQYRPCFKAYNYLEINRPLAREEFNKAFNYAAGKGLRLA
jgi:putative pyruvate formate lyase activating enzyme